jgi:hypothetical protein
MLHCTTNGWQQLAQVPADDFEGALALAEFLAPFGR